MELIITLIIIWVIWLSIIVCVELNSLKSTIKDQKKQIKDLQNHLVNSNISQDKINISFVKCFEDMAKLLTKTIKP